LVDKLEELNNPAIRAAKLQARPEVSADPHMGPGYESDVSDDKPMTGLLLMLFQRGSSEFLEFLPPPSYALLLIPTPNIVL
jgi:hypothetical protein